MLGSVVHSEVATFHSRAALATLFWGDMAESKARVNLSKALSEFFKEVHEVLTTVLMWLVGLHVAAALKHQFVDRDGLLRRMWFTRQGGSA